MMAEGTQEQIDRTPSSVSPGREEALDWLAQGVDVLVVGGGITGGGWGFCCTTPSAETRPCGTGLCRGGRLYAADPCRAQERKKPGYGNRRRSAGIPRPVG